MLLKFFKGFCGLIETAEAAFQSHWNHGILFSGLIETIEAAYSVSLKQQFQMIISNFSAISKPYAKRL
jgi:hypothetical protein